MSSRCWQSGAMDGERYDRLRVFPVRFELESNGKVTYGAIGPNCVIGAELSYGA